MTFKSKPQAPSGAPAQVSDEVSSEVSSETPDQVSDQASTPEPSLEPTPEPDEAQEHYYSVKTVHGCFQNAPIGVVPKVATDSQLRSKVRKHAYDPHQPRGYDVARLILALEWQTYSELMVELFHGGCGETGLASWVPKLYMVTGTEFESTLTNPHALKCIRSGNGQPTQARRLCSAFIEVFGDTSAEQVLQRIVPHNTDLNFALTCHHALLGVFDQPKSRALEVAA
jgi:hypothetical protein